MKLEKQIGKSRNNGNSISIEIEQNRKILLHSPILAMWIIDIDKFIYEIKNTEMEIIIDTQQPHSYYSHAKAFLLQAQSDSVALAEE